MQKEMVPLWSILIVEDEAAVRTYLKKNIDWTAMGFQVIGEAGNGRKALELIEAHRPDLVLCDIVMPIMNGIELLQRTREAGIESRFVMLTCINEFEYARMALQYGASNYVLKLSMSVETLQDILAGIDRELTSRMEQQSRQLLYEYQPVYQHMWEVLAGLREPDGAANQGMNPELDRMLPNVMLLSVMHGSTPFAVEQFWDLHLVKRVKRMVVHLFATMGHTTIFCWSPATIELLPPAEMNLPFPAVYSPAIDSHQLLWAWSLLLRQLDGRHKGLRYVEMEERQFADDPVAAGDITDRLKKYLHASQQEAAPSTDHEAINEIMQYVREYYDQPITLKSMAQLVAMDEHYVSSLFKKKTGENLIAYLHRIRVERAQHYLQHSKLSVSMIGERVGFASDNYFIKIFKRLANLTPADYRKANAQSNRG
jgi:two-component system response regulator YesN